MEKRSSTDFDSIDKMDDKAEVGHEEREKLMARFQVRDKRMFAYFYIVF